MYCVNCIPSKEATEIYPPGERSSVPRSIFPRSKLSNPSWTPLLSWLTISPTLKLKIKSSKMLSIRKVSALTFT